MKGVVLVLVALAALSLASPPAQAQSVYRCTVAGRTVFSDRPCDEGVPPVPATPAKPSAPGAPASPRVPAAPATTGVPASAAVVAAEEAAPATPWKEIVRREIMLGPGVTTIEVTFECTADKRRGRVTAPNPKVRAWTLRDGSRHASFEVAADTFCASAAASAGTSDSQR